MGKIVTKNQPCLDQIKCKSSDARQVYEDGSSFCFSCSTRFSGSKVKEKELTHQTNTRVTVEEIKSFPCRGFQDRGIIKAATEFFEVRSSNDENGKIDNHYYPYSGGGFKNRRLPKDFMWVGTYGGLFGKDKFSGGGKRLVITEGEIDALSVAVANYKKYDKFYPVVSIPSASATDELLSSRDWIRSFSEVILCLDNDKAGEEATQKAIKIIGIDKVKIWKPGDCKDANEVLLKYGPDRLNQLIWDAQAWSPAGIISKEDIWKQITERNAIESHPYPACLTGVNSKIKGKRLGEIALFISGTGSGKSTIIREIGVDLIETTKDKIGIISLEESPGETGIKFSSMLLKRNPANEDISDEDLKVGFDKMFGDDRVVVLDHQGSIKDDSIVDQLEYMCLIGCKYLFIDHITILVSEGADGLTGNEAIDKIMNDLLRLVKRHNVWIGLVSHLRKVQTGGKSFEDGRLPSMDDIRGSGSIKQVSFDIIAFARDMNNKEEEVRNKIKMAVLKSRTMAKTGPVLGAIYNHTTGRLIAEEIEAFETL